MKSVGIDSMDVNNPNAAVILDAKYQERVKAAKEKAELRSLLAANPYRKLAQTVCGKTVVIDAYTILNAYNHMSAEVQHAVKKLLVAGLRNGGKDYAQDVQESLNQLNMDLERHANKIYNERQGE